MRWFVLRALELWFALLIITSAVVAVVRADPESPTLKAVGLSLCDGAPCFRGLKVGTSWDEVLKRFPSLPRYDYDDFRILPVNISSIENALIWPSDDGKTMKHIALLPIGEVPSERRTQITAGEIVARYGAPCHLGIWPPGQPATAFLIYPELKVYVNILRANTQVNGRALFPLISIKLVSDPTM
jgi:hypothetical protein